jgi:hypothetical protein
VDILPSLRYGAGRDYFLGAEEDVEAHYTLLRTGTGKLQLREVVVHCALGPSPDPLSEREVLGGTAVRRTPSSLLMPFRGDAAFN